MKYVKTVELLAMAALLLLFGITSLLVVTQGAQAYERIFEKREKASDVRVALSFLAMHIRHADEKDALSIESTEYGDCLRLSDGDDVNRVYLYKGWLMESFSNNSSAFDPELGDQLVRLDNLSFYMDKGMLHLLAIRKDYSRSLSLSLRAD